MLDEQILQMYFTAIKKKEKKTNFLSFSKLKMKFREWDEREN